MCAHGTQYNLVLIAEETSEYLHNSYATLKFHLFTRKLHSESA